MSMTKKKHSQQLVQVELYIVTERNNPTFYHGQRESTSVNNLQNEFKRLDDSITQHSTVLLLLETWRNNEEDVDVPNFHCVAKFKRPDSYTNNDFEW